VLVKYSATGVILTM